jgi:hypothetical protein
MFTQHTIAWAWEAPRSSRRVTTSTCPCSQAMNSGEAPSSCEMQPRGNAARCHSETMEVMVELPMTQGHLFKGLQRRLELGNGDGRGRERGEW